MQPDSDGDVAPSVDMDKSGAAACCLVPGAAELSALTVAEINLPQPVADLSEAMALAEQEAGKRLGEHMLLSWYDRDRDFESPQHSSECHAASAIPGYVDYGINHGATLKVDVAGGRFVFFYLPLSPIDGEAGPQTQTPAGT
ncbi:MAG: AF1514 family protein [Gammaproteobacteria bacterium]|nr:AF1514 family protein [Gammaproteobacteria bacterium]